MKSNRLVTINADKKFTSTTPQVNQLVVALVASGKTSVTESELPGILRGHIVTKQPVDLIFRYYQKTMIDAGFISIAGFTPRSAVTVVPVTYYNYEDYAKPVEQATALAPVTPPVNPEVKQKGKK